LARWKQRTQAIARGVFMNPEQLQKLHYDRIAQEYEAHYDDSNSQRYRDKFYHRTMFEGMNLTGMNVLEAMCGSGQTTQFLLSEGARVTGLDISNETISSFSRRWPQCNAICASLLDSGLESDSFDAVSIVGGLHHLPPYVESAIGEIHRILKPGGYLCFAEPHKGSLPDLFRQLWYKHDSLFASNEEAIDMTELKRVFASQFSFKRERYLGNVAYLLVLNSMVFRIPLRLKPVYSPALIHLESVLNLLQSKMTACLVVCQWQKR
jgi:SAM-dependent methyltransferase